MKNRHVRGKLSEYIDGMLSQVEASAVKEHLESCPDCMEEYEEMVKIIGLMNQMEDLETPDSFVAKVHKRIDKPSSLNRFVKGLFFPLKVKIPLELAGVAAAALLVIYIVGIRGKQNVYELAYKQRAQSLSVLQEQELEIGTEVDEAITLNKKAQPPPELKEESELKEEKVEKTDKRIDAEEAITPSKKDLPDLVPQEKEIESRAKVEEAVPRSKMVQERRERRPEPQREAIEQKNQIVAEAPSVTKDQMREEPSLIIADKEKGAAEKEALTTPTAREKYFNDILVVLGGKIIESEYNEDTQILEGLVIEIPADKYQELIQILEERGDILKPYPTIKEKDQETIQIRLILQQ